MSINLFGLTPQTFGLRWSEYLSGFGRARLIAEAFEDCGLRRHGAQYFGDMEMMNYHKMREQLSGYGEPLMQEIHSRLAGKARRSGKKPSPYTEPLLTLASVN